jgi:hypothetical protein
MKSSHLILILPCLFAVFIVCSAQTVNRHVFRHDKIGLTYTFPDNFTAKVESELPMQDPSGREHMILALWNSSEHTEAPRIAFLYDTKARPADSSSAEIANHYLSAVRQMWAGIPGVKISGPRKVSFPGCDLWGLDLFQPDKVPHYNAAFVVPLADHRLVAIQINAASQKQLDEEVDSLKELRLDRK